jgi:hypothetical protein
VEGQEEGSGAAAQEGKEAASEVLVLAEEAMEAEGLEKEDSAEAGPAKADTVGHAKEAITDREKEAAADSQAQDLGKAAMIGLVKEDLAGLAAEADLAETGDRVKEDSEQEDLGKAASAGLLEKGDSAQGQGKEEASEAREGKEALNQDPET